MVFAARRLAAAIDRFRLGRVPAGRLNVPTLTAAGSGIRRAAGTAAAPGVCIAAPATMGWLISGRSVADAAGAAIGINQLVPLASMLRRGIACDAGAPGAAFSG